MVNPFVLVIKEKAGGIYTTQNNASYILATTACEHEIMSESGYVMKNILNES